MKLLMTAFMALGLFVQSLSAIEGNYVGKGFDIYTKKKYTTKVLITKTAHHVYDIVYEQLEGNQTYIFEGTGIKKGDYISFVFKGTNQGQTNEGIQVYKIKNKKLEGPYVYLNETLLGKEKLKRVSR